MENTSVVNDISYSAIMLKVNNLLKGFIGQNNKNTFVGLTNDIYY